MSGSGRCLICKETIRWGDLWVLGNPYYCEVATFIDEDSFHEHLLQQCMCVSKNFLPNL